MANYQGPPKISIQRSANENKAGRVLRDLQHLAASGAEIKVSTHAAILTALASVPTRPDPEPKRPIMAEG